jgi:hypothetical protein
MRKQNGDRVVLFASIDRAQHEALRYIAYKEKRSVADVTREALDKYVREKLTGHPIGELEPTIMETLEVKASPSEKEVIKSGR